MRLGEVLKKWRLMCDLDIKTAAEMIGIPAPTLSRFERGGAIDGKHMASIIRWIFADADPVVEVFLTPAGPAPVKSTEPSEVAD